MKKTIGVLLLTATVSSSYAAQNNFFYQQNTKNSFTAMCNGGDLVTGCGFVCPPGQHAQKCDIVQINGTLGVKANCQTETAEIPPVKTTAFCVHQECDDPGVCFVDPDGHYIQQ
jgi:hypothetical protein